MNVNPGVPPTPPGLGTPTPRTSVWPRILVLLIWVAGLAIMLPLGAVGYAVLSGPLCHAGARAEAVRKLGSLELASFQRPTVAPAQNAELRLIQAGNAVSLDRETSELLVELLRRDDAGEILRHRRRLAATVERNRPAIVLAGSARWLSGCNAGIDYRRLDPKFPSFLGQVRLSRLLFVQGLLALDDGDLPAVLAAIDTLGRQATCLEQEPSEFFVLLGSSFERRQLRLIAHVVQDRRCPRELAARIPGLLGAVDLRRAYRADLHRTAAELEAHYVQETGKHRHWSERFAQHLVEDHAYGGGLRCTVRQLEGLDLPFDRVTAELGPPRWRWQQLHWMLCNNWGLGALLRATSDGREMARLAVALRLAMLSGETCRAAWPAVQAGAGRGAGHATLPRLVVARTGSCKLIHPEAAAYKIGLDDSGHPLLVWPLDSPLPSET